METREYLALLATQYNGEWSAIANALRQKEKPAVSYIKDRYITIVDDEYPSSLRMLRYPPWVLFYQGDLSLLNMPAATIVGSRRLTSYGRQITVEASDILKRRFVLVSGLAKGADGIVHEQALHGGHTIGVIGSGLRYRYPAENKYLYEQMKQHHLILSEYPYDTGVRKHHFPWRNRILAALGQYTVVTQAVIRSGTMLTVNEAMNLGKDVYCFPYSLHQEEGMGCNKLILDGGIIVYDMEQLKMLRPISEIKH